MTLNEGTRMADRVVMQSPQGEVKEVEATAEQLSPLMSTGWNQVPKPADHKPAVPAEEEK